MWMLSFLLLCLFGIYYFFSGVSAGYNQAVLTGGVLLGLGLNISLTHPWAIILSVAGSVIGAIFFPHWYYGLFGYWAVQAVIFLITSGLPFVAALFVSVFNEFSSAGQGAKFIDIFKKDSVFSFNGRIGRKLYIIRLLLTMLLLFVAIGFMYFADKYNSSFLLVPGVCLIIGLAIYSIANEAKRLHDMNQSAWWVVVLFIITFLAKQSPETDLVINSGIHIALASIRGTKGPNKYGDDPLGNSADWQNLDYVNRDNNKL